MFDFSIVWSSLPVLWKGAQLTLQLTVIIVLIGSLLALPLALAKNSRNALLRIPAYAYIQFFRGTPSLVQVFLLYYGAAQFEAIQHSFLWPVLKNPFWCVVIALALNSASYTGKTLAAALAAVPKGLREAAFSLGLARHEAFITIDLPLAVRTALPAFGNEIILTCKATALASTVTLVELTGSARLLTSETYAPFEVFTSAGLIYLVINYGLMFLMRRVERMYSTRKIYAGQPMKFITLGPAGSNHEYVMRNYLAFHGLTDKATIDLAVDFEAGADAVLNGDADFLLQVAVHPATMATVAKYLSGLYVIDTFIAGSQDLAVIRRKKAPGGSTLAVMRPTLDYTDASRWEKIDYIDTVAEVTQGLIEGRHDAGLGFAWAVDAHPDALEIDEFIGTVDDAWIVYGRTKVITGNLLAWRDSPAAALYRAKE